MRPIPPLYLSFYTLILSLQIINLSSASSCSKYLTPTTQTTTCSSLRSYPSTELNIPSPYKKLGISFSIRPLTIRPGLNTGNTGVFLSVVLTPPGTTTPKNIMKISYTPTTKIIKFTTEDKNGEQDIMTMSYASDLMNHPMTLSIAVDLTHTSPVVEASILAWNQFQASPILTALNYGSDWIFNPSTLMTVCSNYDGIGATTCDFESLKILYRLPSSIFEMPFSNQVNIIGDYKFEEGSGTTLANSPGKLLASATLSSPSPTWNSNKGLVFDGTPTQYIELTGLTLFGQDLSITTSFGIAFYIKIDQAPSSDQLIFAYECNFLGGITLLRLSVTPSMTLKTYFDIYPMETTDTITAGTWNTIYVVYASTASGYGLSKIYINGVDNNGEAKTTTSPGPATFTANDIIKIGQGFTGELRRFQVYSPAAFALATDLCDSSSCSVEMGFSDPPACQEAVCSTSGYPSFDICESCDDTNCQVCTSPSVCQICKPRFTHAGSSCQPCPAHCSLCVDQLTCKICDSGYGLVNGVCMLCPAGTYLTENQACKELPQTLQDTLETSQTISSGATQMANLISEGSSISLSAAISGKIFSQIKYLNISYSGGLQVALLTWLPSFVSLGLTPDMSSSMIAKIPDHDVPYVFEKYDVPSSFLRNFWENLGPIVFVTVLWLIFKAVENSISSSTKRNPRINYLVRKARVMVQNFLITALYGVSGDLVLYSILEYRTLTLGWNLTLLSFLISIIFLITMFITFWYQTKLLLDYQRIKKQDKEKLEKFTKTHEGSQVLFKDFKDYSLSPQLFLFFLSGRDLLFSLIIATMFEYPLPQTILGTIFSCLMIVYLFLKKPFENIFDFTQQLFFEFVGLIVNIAVLVNAVLDAGKYEAIQARQNIGKLVIVANLTFNFVTAVFMLISIVQLLRDFYQYFRQKQAKKLKALSINNRLQLPSLNDNLAKNKNVSLDSSAVVQNLSSSNNFEIFAFNQESFDLSLLPHHVQLIPNSQNPRKKFPDQLKKSQDPFGSQELSLSPNSPLRSNKIHRQKKSNSKVPFPLPQSTKMPKRKIEADITLDLPSLKSRPKE